MFRVGRRMQLDEQSDGERSETNGWLSRAVHVTNAFVRAKFASCSGPDIQFPLTRGPPVFEVFSIVLHILDTVSKNVQ
jgi:hypothetical protein